MFRKNLKKIPIIRRIYPSLIKKIYNLFNIEIINYTFYGLKLSGNINEPMDKEIFLFQEYENLQINYLLHSVELSTFDYFIDVGANSGLYSLIIANKFNNIKIKSFEPILKSIKKFRKNIILNKNINNIEIFDFGLSNKNSNLLMKSLKKKNYIQTGGFGVAKNTDYLNNLHTEFARFKKGDDILSLVKKKILLKIDAEGHEKEIIDGLDKNLKNNKIFLQIEIFNKNFDIVNDMLIRKNFKKIHKINSDGKIDYYYKNY